jgi:hypothetical protein
MRNCRNHVHSSQLERALLLFFFKTRHLDTAFFEGRCGTGVGTPAGLRAPMRLTTRPLACPLDTSALTTSRTAKLSQQINPFLSDFASILDTYVRHLQTHAHQGSRNYDHHATPTLAKTETRRLAHPVLFCLLLVRR